ncbi:MAG: histidine--tRNA ligase [Epsilonproteobacteria bacterium]|nr:histidine--tRNA ligase [Campylobacterota bacterium]NPA57463.1 histidine--tRNA ligase [Campylobacterota bacterium]
MAIKALRGMRDLLPPLSEKYRTFLSRASQLAENYGFGYIETPIVEESLLFTRSVGESSDIVGKEMYEFVDKGGHRVALRPEGTAGVVRAFIEQKLDRQGGVHRFFYHGPMFRYERPQRGRFREFHQFGVESFGEKSVYEDASIILLAREIVESFGIGYTLKINSLGCPRCMGPYRQRLVEFLSVQEGLCPDCQRRRLTNPIRVLDCKEESCQEIYREAPKLLENLCDQCAKEFRELQEILDTEGLRYEVDPHLVRGLDYYTGSAFEFVSGDLGAQNAIVGGGRYDNLVELLGGRPTPAVGFAIGIERILELFELPPRERRGYYIGTLLPEGLRPALHLATQIRRREVGHLEVKVKSLRAHLKGADKLNLRYAVIIGEDELRKGSVWIKDLEKKEEWRAPLEKVVSEL